MKNEKQKKMGHPFRQDLIFVELILSSSVSFFEDQQSEILCQLQ